MKKEFVVPVFIFAIGFIGTTVLITEEIKKIETIQLSNFQENVNQYNNIIQSDINDYFLHLDFLGTEIVKSNNLKTFRSMTDIIVKQRSEIQGFGWIPRVKFSQREFYENRARIEFNDSSITIKGFINGTIQKSGYQDEYYPIYYIEPMEIKSNKEAHFFDLSSNKQRNNTIQKVLQTKKPALTDIITFVQGNIGFLIMNPKIENNTVIALTNGVYDIEDIFYNVFNKLTINSTTGSLTIYDKNIQIFKHKFNRENHRILNKTINIGDRTWSLVYKDKYKKVEGNIIVISIILSLFTIITSVVFFLLVRLQTTELKLRDIKDTFISYIFHEIRVPLNTIVIGVDNFLQSKLFKRHPRHFSQLKIIKNSLDQTTHILTDILDLSKIENGKFTINKEYVNIGEIIDNINVSFKEYISSKNINFTCSTTLKEIDINVDQNRLLQCLNNYMSNALKYSNNDSRIELTITQENDIFEFMVKDTGIGISEENKKKLFQPYMQLKNNTSEVGTGLGLVIVKNIVELHDGQTWFTSTLGLGSSFYFNIKAEWKITENTDRPKLTHSKRKNYKELLFLIVDDNKSNCFVLEQMLKIKGIKSEFAHNGKICIEKIDAKDYNLIIMDKNMPVMNGIEATKILRSKNVTVPIIALTGISSTDEKQLLIDAGINEIFIKPLDIKLFDKLLEKYFS
jgi:signal transduction histidine kinase